MSLRFYDPSITNPPSTHQKPEEQDMVKLVMETFGYTCAYYGGLVALQCSKPVLFFFKPLYIVTTAPFLIISRILHAVSKTLGPASILPVRRVCVSYQTDGTTEKRSTRSLPPTDPETESFFGSLRITEDSAFQCLGYFFETVFGKPLFDTENKLGGSKSFVSEIAGPQFVPPENRDEPCRAVVRYRSNVLLHLIRFLDFLTVANACRILRACDPSPDAGLKSAPMYKRVAVRFSNLRPCSTPRKPLCKELVLYRGGEYEYLIRWIATCAKQAKPMDVTADERSTTIDEQKVSRNLESDDGSKSEWEDVSLDSDFGTVLILDETNATPNPAAAQRLEAVRPPEEFLNPETNGGQPVEAKTSLPNDSSVTKSPDPQPLPTVSHSSVPLGMSSSLSTIADLTKDAAFIRMKRKEVRVTRVSVTEVTQVNLRRISEEKAVEGETVAEYRADRDSGIQTCEMGHHNDKDCHGKKQHGMACRVKQVFRKVKGKFVDPENARGG